MSFAHQSGAGGVSVHSLLAGLAADDHTQYALADKTRPDPWVAAGDLAARSLADLGTRAHDLLTGLSDDDHAQYALLAGRAGGQALIGGQAAGEHLTLQSTADASRGYVRAQDDLQLLSNILRDASGVSRLEFAAATPHVTIPDGSQVYMADKVAIGSDPPSGNVQLSVRRDPTTPSGCALRADLAAGTGIGAGNLIAILGTAAAVDSLTLTRCEGLDFIANSTQITGSLTDLIGVRLRWGGVFNTLAPTRGSGLMVDSPTVVGGTSPTTVYGLWVKDQGKADITTLAALKIDDQTLAGALYLIEAGPATPNLRLVAGAPAANVSQLWLAVNNGAVVLRQVQIGAAGSGGAGYRQLIVLN